MDRKNLISFKKKYIFNIKPILILVLISLYTFSCRFTGTKPINNNMSMEDVVIKPDNSEIIGNWEVDSFSYELIKKHYAIGNKKVELLFFSNGSFVIKNFPEYEFGGFGEPKNEELLEEASGTWSLYQTKNKWELNMAFNNQKSFEGYSINYFLYLKDEELVIWNFVGDPDLGNRLMFIKK